MVFGKAIGDVRRFFASKASSLSSGVLTDKLAWKRSIPGAGGSSPIVFGDRVYLTTATEGGTSLHLLCVNGKTSAMVWEKKVLNQKAGHKQKLNSYAIPLTKWRRAKVLSCFLTQFLL